MSQNDFNIANQGFPSFRSDLNSALQALASNSAGTSAPTTTYAYMWWYDSTDDILKLRNSGNDAWVDFAEFSQSTNAWTLVAEAIGTPNSNGVGIVFDGGNRKIDPTDGSGSSLDAAVDLGNGSHRFKDLYLSGGVYLGGTGSANLLDDYEGGTWTPVISDATSGGNTASTSSSLGSYTKIGNQVTVHCLVNGIDTTGMGTGNFYIQGIPFTNIGDACVGAMAVNNLTLNANEFGVCVEVLDNFDYIRPIALESGAIKNIVNSSQLTSGSAAINFTLTYTTS